ncbi:hypothetical protein ACJZ2D_007611 [Fusarium nematophilum]
MARLLRQAYYESLACRVFPTLGRFTPTFLPRPYDLATPIKVKDNPKLDSVAMENMLQHLYSDFGVLVFAGASPAQVRQIGTNLMVANIPGLGGLRWLHNGVVRGGLRENDVSQYDKFTVYRFPTKDGHIEEDPISKKAFFTPEALLSMSRQAAQMWAENMFRSARGLNSAVPESLKSREVNFLALNPKRRRGNGQQTVNGPRLPSLNAHVGSKQVTDGFELGIDFYTVVTERYAGRVVLRVVPYDASKEPKGQLYDHHLSLLYKYAPGEAGTNDRKLSGILKDLFQLEQEIWAKRVTTEPPTTAAFREAEDHDKGV